jgi:hypothetical protein
MWKRIWRSARLSDREPAVGQAILSPAGLRIVTTAILDETVCYSGS